MKSVGVVMVTTDKGLCGGLNTNITRVVLSKLKEFEKNGIAVQATAFGNKNLGVLTRIGAKLVSNEVQLGDKPQLDRLLGAIKVQLDAYLEGRIDALYVASTRFVNTMKQEPMFLRLLPLASGLDDPYQTGAENLSKTSEVKSDYSWDYIYEPDARSVIDDLLQRYVEGLLYQAVAENMASEQSARMVAMKAASDNAKKVIGDLQLVYNKTRQAAITKEISEIVGAPPPSKGAASRLKSYQARNRHEQRNHRSVHRRRGGYSVPRDHMPKIYEALTLADEGSSFAEKEPDVRSSAAAGRRRGAHHRPGLQRRPAPWHEGRRHRRPDLGARRHRHPEPHHGRAGPSDRRNR